MMFERVFHGQERDDYIMHILPRIRNGHSRISGYWVQEVRRQGHGIFLVNQNLPYDAMLHHYFDTHKCDLRASKFLDKI